MQCYLHALDPHDEPADIADELEDDGEPGDRLVTDPHQEDADHDGGGGEHHAQHVHPPPAIALWSKSWLTMCLPRLPYSLTAIVLLGTETKQGNHILSKLLKFRLLTSEYPANSVLKAGVL